MLGGVRAPVCARRVARAAAGCVRRVRAAARGACAAHLTRAPARARASARARGPPPATTSTRCHHMSYERQRGPRDACVTARACARLVVAQCAHTGCNVAGLRALGSFIHHLALARARACPQTLGGGTPRARRTRTDLGAAGAPRTAPRARRDRPRPRQPPARKYRAAASGWDRAPPAHSRAARVQRACSARARPSARRAGPRRRDACAGDLRAETQLCRIARFVGNSTRRRAID